SDFYRKSVMYRAMPIISSEKVNDYALKEAYYIIDKMASNMPEVIDTISENKVRCVVMACDEMTTDIPEHSDLKPKNLWDRKTRGVGATTHRPAVSCGEENLLCYRDDPYIDENILIHEFAHVIHMMGINYMDDTFDQRLKKVYQQAIDKGLWKGTYAISNHIEYFAEGTQSWFDNNRQNDKEHNHVNTRKELIAYDPGLAKILREVYGDNDWSYHKPMERSESERHHLKGFDPKNSPKFVWPEELDEWYKKYMEHKK
ncbi:MAG: hypothetical protein KAS23_03175, partial [Anaerohalosphaera sp.]|nr:hypothetical protein [Anaerohalosphaera sp.]